MPWRDHVHRCAREVLVDDERRIQIRIHVRRDRPLQVAIDRDPAGRDHERVVARRVAGRRREHRRVIAVAIRLDRDTGERTRAGRARRRGPGDRDHRGRRRGRVGCAPVITTRRGREEYKSGDEPAARSHSSILLISPHPAATTSDANARAIAERAVECDAHPRRNERLQRALGSHACAHALPSAGSSGHISGVGMPTSWGCGASVLGQPAATTKARRMRMQSQGASSVPTRCEKCSQRLQILDHGARVGAEIGEERMAARRRSRACVAVVEILAGAGRAPATRVATPTARDRRARRARRRTASGACRARVASTARLGHWPA